MPTSCVGTSGIAWRDGGNISLAFAFRMSYIYGSLRLKIMSKKKYYSTITYYCTKSMDVEVEAETSEEAWLMVNAISDKNKPEGFHSEIHAVEDGETVYDPIGICEVSGRPIWADSEYYNDEDGIMWLKEYDPE